MCSLGRALLKINFFGSMRNNQNEIFTLTYWLWKRALSNFHEPPFQNFITAIELWMRRPIRSEKYYYQKQSMVLRLGHWEVVSKSEVFRLFFQPTCYLRKEKSLLACSEIL